MAAISVANSFVKHGQVVVFRMVHGLHLTVAARGFMHRPRCFDRRAVVVTGCMRGFEGLSRIQVDSLQRELEVYYLLVDEAESEGVGSRHGYEGLLSVTGVYHIEVDGEWWDGRSVQCRLHGKF